MGWVTRRFDLPRQTQDCNIIALETDCNQYLVPETAGKYKLLLNVGAVGWITEGLTEPGAKTPPFAWYYVLWKNDDLPRQARDRHLRKRSSKNGVHSAGAREYNVQCTYPPPIPPNGSVLLFDISKDPCGT